MLLNDESNGLRMHRSLAVSNIGCDKVDLSNLKRKKKTFSAFGEIAPKLEIKILVIYNIELFS